MPRNGRRPGFLISPTMTALSWCPNSSDLSVSEQASTRVPAESCPISERAVRHWWNAALGSLSVHAHASSAASGVATQRRQSRLPFTSLHPTLPRSAHLTNTPTGSHFDRSCIDPDTRSPVNRTRCRCSGRRLDDKGQDTARWGLDRTPRSPPDRRSIARCPRCPRRPSSPQPRHPSSRRRCSFRPRSSLPTRRYSSHRCHPCRFRPWLASRRKREEARPMQASTKRPDAKRACKEGTGASKRGQGDALKPSSSPHSPRPPTPAPPR